MKIRLVLILALCSGAAMAQTSDAQTCQKNYATAISGCAQGLNFLEPSVRAGAQKACVKKSKMPRDSCLNGSVSPVCLDSGLAAYNITAAACVTNNNPPNGGGDVICEEILQQQQDDCISEAVTTLNTCNASCPIQ